MSVDSLPELLNALRTNPEEILGTPESRWVEFKGTPYQLDLAWSKIEFAKDVTAIANAGNGAIVLGIQTSKDEASNIDRASELKPIPASQVNRDQIYSVISEWVYPRLDIDVEAHQQADGGLFWSITTLPKPSDDPYLVKGETTNNQDRPSRNYFGLYERNNLPANIAYPAEQIHVWIQRGRNREEGVPTIESTPPPTSPPVDSGQRLQIAEQTLADDVAALELGEIPCFYYIQAIPTETRRLRRFFEGTNDSLIRVMSDPPEVRPNGFGLPDGIRPLVVEGRIRAAIPNNESLSVQRDGTTTGILGRRYLAWATERFMPAGQVGINTLALTEFTFAFWQFLLQEVLPRSDNLVESYSWRVGLRGINEPQKLLLPIGFGEHVFRTDIAAPPPKDFDMDWERGRDFDAGTAAFASVREIYEIYGRDEALITGASNGRISKETIEDAVK